MDWLIIGLLGYFGHAISTSIDKVIMNRKHDIYTTSMLKLFIDGIIVLAIGLLFFDFPTSPKLILWSVLVGFLYAAGNITYYKSLKTKDIGVQVPYVNAAITLLIFLTALWFFRESAILSNYLGVLLILVGMYLVLSNRYKLPRIDKGLFLMTLLVIIVVIQYLVTKQALFQVQPIPLAATMYFSATIFT
ncbi:MAG: EamA family transporter, partial [Nanoarchaeota archaeon]|nr:EamA family transporter [Nanoarchaeota archaeon]